MSDLISRSALLEDMRKELEKAANDESITEFECKVLMTSALALKGFVERQPTAYDVEKVVADIKKSPTDDDGLIVKDGEEPMIWKSKAIEIVRNGGKE